MSTKSQEEQILSYLQLGFPLTPRDADRLCGCTRLAARVYDLRGRGYEIKSRLIEVGKKRVAQYSL